jgi:hypothetical protein
MSIINIVIERDRVLIGADTLAGFMEEGQSLLTEDQRRDKHTLKFSLFPHINMAMTHRGDGLVLTNVRTLLESALLSGFDEAVEYMPWIMEQAYTLAMDVRKAQHGMQTFEGAEAVLVGWSQSQQRFAGARWRRYPQGPAFEALPVGDVLVMPEIDRLGPVETPDTPEKMEAVTRQQLDYVRRECPSYPCGGRLLLAEMTRDAVTVRTIADLEA